MRICKILTDTEVFYFVVKGRNVIYEVYSPTFDSMDELGLYVESIKSLSEIKDNWSHRRKFPMKITLTAKSLDHDKSIIEKLKLGNTLSQAEAAKLAYLNAYLHLIYRYSRDDFWWGNKSSQLVCDAGFLNCERPLSQIGKSTYFAFRIEIQFLRPNSFISRHSRRPIASAEYSRHQTTAADNKLAGMLIEVLLDEAGLTGSIKNPRRIIDRYTIRLN